MKPARWLFLLLLVLMVIGVMRVRFAVQVLDILPADLPVVQGLKLYQEHFANARELILTVSAPDPDQAEAAAQAIAVRLRRETNLVSRVTWQAPWLEHPEQGAELIAYLWLNQAHDQFKALAGRLSPAQAPLTLKETREQLAVSLSPKEIATLSYDPFGLSQLPASDIAGFGQGPELFSSTDGKFRILFAQARGTLPDYRACLGWLQQVRSVVEAGRLKKQFAESVVVGYTGAPAFVAEISHGMETDLRTSVTSTVVIIALLFWWIHRRLAPLAWLLTLLAIILGITLALGGLLFGTLSVISVGFAAILLGLAVDYALVLYQEAVKAPLADPKTIRRALFPGIFWSAATTSLAFLLLNFGGLPGLAQLGSLVGIGIAVAAFIMLNYFLPPLMKGRRDQLKESSLPSGTSNSHSVKLAWTVTAILGLAAIAVLVGKPPVLDRTANALRPRHSDAYAAMEEIKNRISSSKDPEWLVISARDESALAEKLDRLEPALARDQASGRIRTAHLPTALLARPERQKQNAVLAERITAQAATLRQIALDQGFTDRSLAFANGIFDTWRLAAVAPGVFWPTNDMSLWALEKVIARQPDRILALGLLEWGTPPGSSDLGKWAEDLKREEIYLASWSQLGSALLKVVQRDFWRILLPLLILLPLCLWFAFKSISGVLLSLASVGFSSLCLLAWMSLAGWSWNLMNLMAVPLLLGAGIDYTIHTQLGLRRHHGNIATTRQIVGRALFLCAATTVAGFGSNAWSSNGGLMSLGKVCAAGIGLAYLTAAFLLPYWWRSWPGNVSSSQPSARRTPAGPSSLYRADLWRVGLWMVRVAPHWICSLLMGGAMRAYWWLARERREVVIRNLQPAFNDDSRAARQKAKALYRQFGCKLLDLWRYEAGLPIDDLLGPSSGWEHFAAAQAQKRGVLFLTTHVGNWEFGGPWLTSRGHSLQVVTLAEPGQDFTALRQASRARWNIETLVIGEDPFAFIELIRRLENGATVALLVDRPPPATATEVQLFGRSFAASTAAAELARASGCVLLPVYLPRLDHHYAAHILPAIPYDRAALRDRLARQGLTQQIMRAFEPVIRQHLDQWYHFVPIWPK